MFKVYWSYRASPNHVHSITLESWDEATLFYESLFNDGCLAKVSLFDNRTGSKLGEFNNV